MKLMPRWGWMPVAFVLMWAFIASDALGQAIRVKVITTYSEDPSSLLADKAFGAQVCFVVSPLDQICVTTGPQDNVAITQINPGAYQVTASLPGAVVQSIRVTDNVTGGPYQEYFASGVSIEFVTQTRVKRWTTQWPSGSSLLDWVRV